MDGKGRVHADDVSDVGSLRKRYEAHAKNAASAAKPEADKAPVTRTQNEGYGFHGEAFSHAKEKGHANPTEEAGRSEENTSELQSLMRTSYAVFCLRKNNTHEQTGTY